MKPTTSLYMPNQTYSLNTLLFLRSEPVEIARFLGLTLDDLSSLPPNMGLYKRYNENNNISGPVQCEAIQNVK